MFDKLRKKITVSNTVIFSVFTLVLVSFIFLVTFLRTTITINEGAAKADDLVRVINTGSGLSITQSKLREPNCLVLLINMGDLRVAYTSDEEMYEDEVIDEIILEMIKKTQSQGRAKVGKLRFAYKLEPFVSETSNRLKISLYEYSEQYRMILSLGIVLGIAFTASVGVIFLLFRQYAKKTVAPVEDAFVKQRELVANASHELKTPITIISTSLSVINSIEKSEGQQKWLDTVSHQTKRMTTLVNDMLELARVEQDEFSEFERINLSEALEGILLSMEVSFFENELELETKIDDALFIKAHMKNLEKLFYILLENAVKYTPKKGKVWVNLFAEKRKVVFKIKNTGEGIEKEKLDKLFDRFYKTDVSHNSGGGTGSFGLGLSIAKTIVEGFGGQIYATSKEGEYTEFTVVFNKV